MKQHNDHKQTPVNVVWFKRDLRVYDNRVLSQAQREGLVIPLFIVEDEYWQLPDMSGRQWMFVKESLEELRDELAALGQPLVVRRGDALRVLDQLDSELKISSLWSHEETGNAWTFERDKRVADWCRDKGIQWHEIQQSGTQRKLSSRNGWAKAWDQTMAEPITIPTELQPLDNLSPGAIPS
ncbi:MAG: deoxyribodipyrimidine photo-lyase, partial [Pseudomonadota bacterium]